MAQYEWDSPPVMPNLGPNCSASSTAINRGSQNIGFMAELSSPYALAAQQFDSMSPCNGLSYARGSALSRMPGHHNIWNGTCKGP
ncbi:hypothetical protein N7520_009603 [Penicillium odoratum]|uniref:uncharacterized protein n=1 Tax=Penicillium odoratum TaxID=1167516 RepID=UPI002547CA9A|nr:uncharacterized protein N7520_009603 [Penicillium odoratum]KAJ5752686.1 hypothetical protein N7520_009603 [Penicillium odoratum]